MKINKYLPIIGFTSLAMIATPVIASCSCTPPHHEDEPIELSTHFEQKGDEKHREYSLMTDNVDIEANQTYSIYFDLKDWEADLPEHLEFGNSAILGHVPNVIKKQLFINNVETAFVPIMPGGLEAYILNTQYTQDSVINVLIAFDAEIKQQENFIFFLRYY